VTRVLHVITGLAPGGAERQLELLIGHLPVTCEVAVFSNAGSVAEAIERRGIPVHDLRMRGNRDARVLPRLIRLIRRGQFDVVHTHLYRACVFGRIAARLAGVRRVVATEHSLGSSLIEGRRKTAAVRGLYLATERLGAVTIAVSATVADRLGAWGVRPERTATIPNGIDTAAFAFDPDRRRAARQRLGIADTQFVVGAVGRLVPTKRFDVLIEALAGLPGARLLLVGGGPERPDLEELAVSHGVRERVIFAGERPDIPELLAAMDVFAAPSAEEAFGLAPIEALASGLPVIYVNCPALEDLDPLMSAGARRVNTGVPSFRDELESEMLRGQRRITPPPAVAHYDITRLAPQVAALYARLVESPGRDAL
jgi:glycosyltransferase involved in cell wall biosynthesis